MTRAREISDYVETQAQSSKGWWWLEDTPIGYNNSYNISSGTDNGTGSYYSVLTNALVDSFGAVSQQTLRTAIPHCAGSAGASMVSTTQIEHRTLTNASAFSDSEVTGNIFGEFA